MAENSFYGIYIFGKRNFCTLFNVCAAFVLVL